MTTLTSPGSTVATADNATGRDATVSEAGASRVAAGCGIAFVVLSFISNFLPGAPLASDASPAKVVAYFRDHGSGIKGQEFIGAIGIVALLWWFGAFWQRLSRAEHDRPRLATVAAVSLASGLTLAMVAGSVQAAAAQRATTDPSLLPALWTLSIVALAAAGIGVGTSLIASCVVTYRARMAPRWTSYLGWAAGLAFLAGSAGMLSDSNVLNLVALAAFLLWCAWLVATSVLMWRGAGDREIAAPSAGS